MYIKYNVSDTTNTINAILKYKGSSFHISLSIKIKNSPQISLGAKTQHTLET